MSHNKSLGAGEALDKLKQGNAKYLDTGVNSGDVSPALRLAAARHGQSPYAVIVTCSDSRVIPESIFSAGIGELFVVRVAGNVIDDIQLGSIEYAAEHLGSRLIVVLGHTGCGAVGAALEGGAGGYIRSITDEIRLAIGDEKDPYRASCLNVERSVGRIVSGLGAGAGRRGGAGDDDGTGEGLLVVGAMYHIDTGAVEFL